MLQNHTYSASSKHCIIKSREVKKHFFPVGGDQVEALSGQWHNLKFHLPNKYVKVFFHLYSLTGRIYFLVIRTLVSVQSPLTNYRLALPVCLEELSRQHADREREIQPAGPSASLLLVALA